VGGFIIPKFVSLLDLSSTSGIAKHDRRCMQFADSECKVIQMVTDHFLQQLHLSPEACAANRTAIANRQSINRAVANRQSIKRTVNNLKFVLQTEQLSPIDKSIKRDRK
jgi:hypothetical protein